MYRSIIICLAMYFCIASHGKEIKGSASVSGHVINNGEHIPFVTLLIKGTTLGTVTDETGHFQLTELPVGIHILRAQSVGFKAQEVEVALSAGESREVEFDLEEDVLGLDEVVVTADRNETNRRDASTIVNTINPKLMQSTQSVTLSDGLNFVPGLRMENNCNNCGFSQVRMNGLEGPYSQILINSRPIFSGLAGVYGLELIPSNMIERVEVIRGGGSALYGSNAIAGTINLILKDPIKNAYEAAFNTGLSGVGVDGSGSAASDYTANVNASVVSDDNKTGLALYGFYRDKEPFDANNDGFSEITNIKNTTFGSRLFHRFSARNKVSLDFFNIKEERRGGNKFETLLHESDVSEAVDHNITTAAVTYDQFYRLEDKLSVYVSGQKVNRDSYYGANQSLSDYGFTEDFSYVAGAQYNARLGISNIIFGVENNGALLKDNKLGYPDLENAYLDEGNPDNPDDDQIIVPHVGNTLIADQTSNTLGAFAQYEINLGKWQLSAGLRYDNYRIEDRTATGEAKTGNVYSPRLTLKYDIEKYLQGRLSYSQGYRAPQIFDEDLHIETSGSRKVLHRNAPGLKQETSHSYMASLDFNKKIGSVFCGLLLEGFYTRLEDAFANEFGQPDADGSVVYTRVNAEGGAMVGGINIELNLVPSENFSMVGGFTLQKSEYEETQEFGETRFFRVPDEYGYFTLDWKPTKTFSLSTTGNYTGKMPVPYFGNQLASPEEGELRESDSFFDLGLKLTQNIKLKSATMQIFAGVKNIFHSYQDDFDRGADRDPAYVYGPMNPRTAYAGIRIGNFIR